MTVMDIYRFGTPIGYNEDTNESYILLVVSLKEEQKNSESYIMLYQSYNDSLRYEVIRGKDLNPSIDLLEHPLIEDFKQELIEEFKKNKKEDCL